MILLDTNIVIYLHGNSLSDEATETLRNSSLGTCNIVIAEVLGYKHLNDEAAKYFSSLFDSMKNYLFDENVTNKVIEIRKAGNLLLPDAIIAATALVNDLVLWTHNLDDFKEVQNLKLLDPFAN